MTALTAPLTVSGAMLDGETVGVRCEDGVIAAIGSGVTAKPGDKTLDAAGAPLVPALVNGHTHAAMTLFRGYGGDLPLMRWLQEKVWQRPPRPHPPLGDRAGRQYEAGGRRRLPLSAGTRGGSRRWPRYRRRRLQRLARPARRPEGVRADPAPASDLVYAASGSVVDTTVVAGRVLMRGGAVEDAEEVVAQAAARARRLGIG